MTTITEEEILNVFYLLDLIKVKLINDSVNDNCYNLKYSYLDDIITINYDWSTYEEGSIVLIIIDLKNNTIQEIEDGGTVYGELKENTALSFKNYIDIEKYIKYYFNY